MGKLEGKVAVITGASSGIGWEICKLFASEGAKVVGMARRGNLLEKLAAEIKEAGGAFAYYAGDVTLDKDIDAAIDKAVAEFGAIDILVNNAGTLDHQYPVGEMSNERWDFVIGLNLTAPMKAMRKAIPYMLEQENGGVIVNMSSVAALRGCIGGAAYTASKNGVIGLTKNTAYMYAEKKIRCNCICPGGVKTPMLDDSFTDASPLGTERSVKACGPMVRPAEPQEIADVALFLASDESRVLNGVCVAADSGFVAG